MKDKLKNNKKFIESIAILVIIFVVAVFIRTPLMGQFLRSVTDINPEVLGKITFTAPEGYALETSNSAYLVYAKISDTMTTVGIDYDKGMEDIDLWAQDWNLDYTREKIGSFDCFVGKTKDSQEIRIGILFDGDFYQVTADEDDEAAARELIEKAVHE